MQRTETYQDTFLNQARKERTPLTVFLVNGFQMRGLDHCTVGSAAPESGRIAPS